MNKPLTFHFVTKENIQLGLHLHKAKNSKKNATIVYFHGGGLMFGTKDDLPEIYINQFLNAGYDFLALDYLLAPEAKLDFILSSAVELLRFCLKNPGPDFTVDNYVLFGRSAGAYLALMLCDRLRKGDTKPPQAIISLYGYASLDAAEFAAPSKYYRKFPSVTDESIRKIIAAAPPTAGPLPERFFLYIKARQEGTWPKQLCGNEAPEKYSLTTEQLQFFPPTFLAAATLDPDVPYRMSKTLSKLIPDSHLVTLYKEAHDFDRDTADESGRLIYAQIISWLEDKL